MVDSPSNPMSILWIGRINSTDRSGEVLYDRNISAVLRENCDVTFFEPPRIGAIGYLWSIITGQIIYRGRFNTKKTISKVQQITQNVDAVVCSWEHYDFLVNRINKPVVLILHNITSVSVLEIYPRQPLYRFLAFRAAKHEKKTYTLPNIHSILTLSKLDRSTVEAIGGSKPVIWVPPGAPKSIGLSKSATFLPELVLSGTYDWSVKRRDLLRFFGDVRNGDLVIATDDKIPESCLGGMTITKSNFQDALHCENHIRMGVIPDRFVSGHKLKGTFFIANNAIILSYADIRNEFDGIPDADVFVRIIGGLADIRSSIDFFSAMPSEELHDRFTRFKTACLDRFQWDHGGQLLWRAVQDAGSRTQ